MSLRADLRHTCRISLAFALAAVACGDATVAAGPDAARAADGFADVSRDVITHPDVGTLDAARTDGSTSRADASTPRADATTGTDAGPLRVPAHYYASSRADYGTVDPNSNSYEYAPAFVYAGGLYHYFACVGVAGDYVQHKSASSLAGLAAAPLRTVLSPSPGETHTCDPAVVQGSDGRWYLHYSNTPGGTYTDAGVAVASRIEGPYTKISTDLLGHYSNLSAGQYGRGQTTVAQGPDGQWYMAFTNQIEPIERNSIIVLRAPDPSFAVTRTEVARIDPGVIGGWSTQMSYDPQSGHFVIIVPGGAGFRVNSFDTAFRFIGYEDIALPSGAGTPGEGQAFLTDGMGRLLRSSHDAYGSLVIAGATHGPVRSTIPTWVTGPNQWRRYRVDPLGIVDDVSPRPGAVHVAGWSFDPNDPSWPIDTHIYVGLPGGASRTGTNDGATRVLRADVNASQGTSGPHGFDLTIPTALRGSVEVCTAAINIGSGENNFLACRTVTVTN